MRSDEVSLWCFFSLIFIAKKVRDKAILLSFFAILTSAKYRMGLTKYIHLQQIYENCRKSP